MIFNLGVTSAKDRQQPGQGVGVLGHDAFGGRPSQTCETQELTPAPVPARRAPVPDPARRLGRWPAPGPTCVPGTRPDIAPATRPAASARPTAAARAGPAPQPGQALPSCPPAPHATPPQGRLRPRVWDRQDYLSRRARSRRPQPPAVHLSRDRRHRRRTIPRTATAHPSGQVQPRQARPQSHRAHERNHLEPRHPVSLRAARAMLGSLSMMRKRSTQPGDSGMPYICHHVASAVDTVPIPAGRSRCAGTPCSISARAVFVILRRGGSALSSSQDWPE